MFTMPDQEPPCNIVVGFGNEGAVLYSYILAAHDPLGATAALVAYGLGSGARPIDGSLGKVLRSQASDITLLPSEVQRIKEEASDARRADVPAKMLMEFWEKLLTVVPPSAPINPQLLGCAGLGDIETIAPGLSHVKTKRLPNLSITLCVRWLEPGHDDDRTAAGIRQLHALRQDAIIDSVFLIHPRSPLARDVSEDIQTHLVARVWAALLAAHGTDHRNKRLADVSRSVGARAGTGGTFACMGIDVARVAEGKRTAFSRSLRWSGKPDIGYGDMTDCIQQATSLAARLLTDERTRTFPAPIDPTKPPFELLFGIPVPYTDPRFPRSASQLRTWAMESVPMAGTPLVVSGSGRLPQHERGRYYCFVAYLFPIADELLLPGAERPQATMNPSVDPTIKRKLERL